MLGVRRATVSLTAGLLHNAGLISYRHAHGAARVALPGVVNWPHG
jgi:hypothetical protein